MASLYLSMMSSGLRQFLARPISALVSAFIPFEVSAPRTEQDKKWAEGLCVSIKYLRKRRRKTKNLGCAAGLSRAYTKHLPYLANTGSVSLSSHTTLQCKKK